MLLLAAIAVVGLLGLGGLGTAYGILHHNYSGYLDQIKAKIAEDKTKFDSGDTRADATLTDQYNFYAVLSGDIGNLPALLAKLNGEYTLLPWRATENSLGITDLQSGMADMSNRLVTLRECIEEDASVSGALGELLDSSAAKDVSQDMAALAARNDALYAKITGVAFTGEFESKRAGFEGAIKKRGDALHYLEEDMAVQSELIKLLSDVQSETSDTIAKLEALSPRNDALESRYQGVDLQGVAGGRTIDFATQITARRQQITAGKAYMAELEAVRNGVAAFCKGLGSPVQGGAFAEKLASYMTRVNGLKALEDQLKAINEKAEYADLPVKHEIPDLGLTPEGEALHSYTPAISALNSGITKSAEMETQIDSLLKDTKMKLTDKVGALEMLLSENSSIINTLQYQQSTLPDDLRDGCASFLSGCQERATFLNEFMAYAQYKVKADGHNSLYSHYVSQKKKYLQDADYWTTAGDKDQADYFKQRANDQQELANAEKKSYNDCLKEADKHKKAYEASRKAYQELFKG
jgi:hypothetical protein